jgi:hypothetical protein
MDKMIEKLCTNGNEQYVKAFMYILKYLLFGIPNGAVVGSASPYFNGIFGFNDIDVLVTGIPAEVLREKCTGLAQKHGTIFNNFAFFTKNGKKVIDVICIPFKKGIIPDIVYIEGIPTFNLKYIRMLYNNDRDEDADQKKDDDKKKYLDVLIQLSESKLLEMFDLKETLSKPKSPRTPKQICESPSLESPRTPKRIRESPSLESPTSGFSTP